MFSANVNHTALQISGDQSKRCHVTGTVEPRRVDLSMCRVDLSVPLNKERIMVAEMFVVDIDIDQIRLSWKSRGLKHLRNLESPLALLPYHSSAIMCVIWLSN